jgi:hypothetical protein
MADSIIDELNRSAKLFIDSGAAATVEEAIAMLHCYRMHLVIGQDASQKPTHQAALLTALNCGRRTFLGGVSVSGSLDVPLALPVVPGKTLAEAVRYLGGVIRDDLPTGVPLVCVGAAVPAATSPFAVRTTFDGWRAAVLPLDGIGLAETKEFAPSGVLAGALAVAEVFAHLEGNAIAGHRTVGMSLWNQNASANWQDTTSDGPVPAILPADFWIIGLGHLGQALLWSIGLLPYANPGAVRLFLQDVDIAGGSTESTSILTYASDNNRLKTRICADWAEGRGFKTRLVERRLSDDLRAARDEPLLAFCGVDNPQARALIEDAGFATVFEAGLGSGVEDFRLIRTHSFPGPSKASSIWSRSGEIDLDHTTDKPPAYEDLQRRGKLDICGLTRLAQVAVGAPFVGTVTAALVLSQMIRMIADGIRPVVSNLDLRAVQHRSMVPSAEADLVLFRTTSAAA